MLDSLFKIYDSIFIFDVETTGLSAKNDEIIEIAMLQIKSADDSLVVETALDMLIRLTQGRSLPPEITDLTGITAQHLLENGVSKEEACDRLSFILKCPNALLAAYNVQFDLGFLFHFLNRFNMAELLLNFKMLDVLTVFKDRKPYPHKLGDAAFAYSLDMKNGHRALDDAHMTFAVLREMGKELDDLDRYVNLFGYNPKYGISGQRISSIKYIPQEYNAKKKLYEGKYF